ncbi:Adenosine 3'-phospho 5'-phosphosulfate transporter 2 [Frankliniella fusca]|uniref:Adenosine 3'-phospho 5'-phosphosulfate transporter 2 n=1 Tax=Frankliniella fusca TaxID=407009 RepID=A0AAE1LEQ7_9NEOP|nr:Adenosine 3'-phospho 5'-phosphosulfate transporter 2 [Frankliniella fusca]
MMSSNTVVVVNNERYDGGKQLKSEGSDQNANDLKILWFDISYLSSFHQFLVCCLAVFIFYLLYGYLQELLFTLDSLKPCGWYLTLIQFGYYSVFGTIEMKLRRMKGRKIPLKIYFILAFLTLGTMGFSNSSLQYLNYPTQVIFKCCKLIPVMVGGILIQKKVYGTLDFLAAFCMCLGLTLFTLADSQISPVFSTIGVIMISCALLCDAAIGNVQEKSMKQYKASNAEVVLYSYSIGFVYLFVILLFSGNLTSSIGMCSEYPAYTYGLCLLFALTGYLGIQVVLILVRTSGALAAATVTTCRKAVSIVISFLFFAKPFTFQYLWSGLLVVLGIYLNICSKNQTLRQNLTNAPKRIVEFFTNFCTKKQSARTLLSV